MEYGGTNKSEETYLFSLIILKKFIMRVVTKKVIKKKTNLSENDLFFFTFPSDEESKLKFTHWSYFENWDPYRNYLVAKEFCGLEENKSSNMGTLRILLKMINFSIHFILM